MDQLFKICSGFPSLSLKDLVEARDDAYEQLMSKRNVLATGTETAVVRASASLTAAPQQPVTGPKQQRTGRS